MHKFNKLLKQYMLTKGQETPLAELVGSVVESLAPQIGADSKARAVFGLMSWTTAKSVRVCAQRVRDTRKVIRDVLNKRLKESQLRGPPETFCLPAVYSPTTMKNAGPFVDIQACYREATGVDFPPVHYVVLGIVEFEEIVGVSA